MSAIEYRFLEPLDVLLLRGNKLFGDPGSYGESLIPPWPSVAAGALRSRMLTDDKVNLAAFARGDVDHPALGTPQTPGSFAVSAFHLARRHQDGSAEMLIQPPADLSIVEDESGKTTVRRLAPLPPATGILSSAHFPLLPVLAENNRAKPAGGYWLTEAGWCSYLRAEVLQAADLVKSGDLWALDHRVGVGLDAARRSAADGRLFSMEAVALKPGVGFLVAVTGAVPPVSGAVRLGGDGRGAVIQKAPIQPPEPDYVALIKAGRCRLILASPGLFAEGWRLPGMVPDGRFEFNGVRAQVVCAAVPRAEVISGWDLAKWQPKPALRAAPGGSVYWLDKLEATPEALRKLAEMGLWGEPCEDSARRAEGYNRFHLAAY